MKFEIIRAVPVKPPTDEVVMRVPLHVAQMIAVSMGRNITNELPDNERDDHYKAFSMLLDLVGRGRYQCKSKGDSMLLVKS